MISREKNNQAFVAVTELVRYKREGWRDFHHRLTRNMFTSDVMIMHFFINGLNNKTQIIIDLNLQNKLRSVLRHLLDFGRIHLQR